MVEWTEKMLETLHRMWPEGHTCTVIGAKIGVSGSAVAGKAHRRGLPHRANAIKGDGPEIQRRRMATKEANLAKKREEQGLPPLPRTLQPLRSPRTAPRLAVVELPTPAPPSCCWPIGEPGSKGFRFCGGPLKPGKPYCIDHCKLAYVHR